MFSFFTVDDVEFEDAPGRLELKFVPGPEGRLGVSIGLSGILTSILMRGFDSSNSGRRCSSLLSNLGYKRRKRHIAFRFIMLMAESRIIRLTGGTLIFITSWVYDLSYRQFPSKFPKLRRARLIPSVTASFLDYMRAKINVCASQTAYMHASCRRRSMLTLSRAAPLLLEFSTIPYPISS